MYTKIYFDTCCYGRRWDNQNDPQIAAETADINAIIYAARYAGHTIIGSEVVVFELGNIRDATLRAAITGFYDDTIDEGYALTEYDIERARALRAEGVGITDSQHLAVAEAANVDFLVTTDIDFERIVTKKKLSVVNVIKPLTYIAKGGYDGQAQRIRNIHDRT